MAFSRNKVIFGIVGTSLIAGVAMARNNNSKSNETAPQKHQNKKTITKVKLGTKYKISLIGDEGNFWVSRFDDLKKGKPKHKKLLETQKLDLADGLDKLKETCEEINSEEEDSELFEDFQNFCALKNKDDPRLIQDKNGFASKYSNFYGTNKSNLSEGFANIWDRRDKSATEEWKQAMLDECKKLQEKMYVDDLADKNFNSYCTTNP